VLRIGTGDAAYHAFEPEPIPRQLSLPGETQLVLSTADQALGRLNGMGELLPDPHVLVRPYLRREAVASTRIEGTQSSLGEVLAAEAQLQSIPDESEVTEVLNYVRAFELGVERLADLPLSGRLLREMHVELLRGVRGEHRALGRFRRTQNWIGGTGPGDAVFVPPPPQSLPGAVSDLERFLHEDPQLPILVRCALAHYQFETIHPFLDGNGRLGRLLIVFYLVERGVLSQPLLYLSAYFEEHRDQYVTRLQAVREEGRYEEWIHFFLQAVAVQARASSETVERLLGVQAELRDRLMRAGARGKSLALADGLIANPFLTAPRVARDLGLSRQGARYAIQSLERANVVQRVRQPGRRALFVAPDVLRALEAD
jgi:Fic family protein